MAEAGDYRINGKIYDPNTLTFRENREIERITREELFAGREDYDTTQLSASDTMPPMIVVLVRRDNPDYTLEEALDLSPHEVTLTEADIAKLNDVPPTEGAARAAGSKAKSSTSGARGSQT